MHSSACFKHNHSPHKYGCDNASCHTGNFSPNNGIDSVFASLVFVSLPVSSAGDRCGHEGDNLPIQPDKFKADRGPRTLLLLNPRIPKTAKVVTRYTFKSYQGAKQDKGSCRAACTPKVSDMRTTHPWRSRLSDLEYFSCRD